MVKQSKRILFITDDFDNNAWQIRKKLCESGNIFYDSKSNYLKFKFDKVKTFEEIDNRKRYDVILIDYGIIGDKEKNIEFLESFWLKGILLAWVGGLGGSNRYNEDAKVMFPKQTFLHNLPSSNTGHEGILLLLYDLFEGGDKRGM